MQETENQRLKIFRLSLKKTQLEFAKAVGLKQGSYADVERGKVRVSGDIKNALSKEFSLNIEWLESAKLPMISSNAPRLEAIPLRLADPFGYEATGDKIYELQDGSLMMEVPIIPIKAQAGYVHNYTYPEFYEDLPTIPVMIEKRALSTYMAFEVKGESMVNLSSYELAEKSIFPGRIVVGRLLDKSKWRYKLHTHNYDTWVIVHKIKGIVCKTIADHDVDKGLITIHSLNPDFKDEIWNLEEVDQIFSVVKIDQNKR